MSVIPPGISAAIDQAATYPDELHEVLGYAFQQARYDDGGDLADYIPELAKVNPGHLGLAVATAHGRLYQFGDVEKRFTIQSVSKAFTYCLALEVAGRATVLRRVGVELSGDAFNAIEFDPLTRRPYNSMVNAGAITVAALLTTISVRVHLISFSTVCSLPQAGSWTWTSRAWVGAVTPEPPGPSQGPPWAAAGTGRNRGEFAVGGLGWVRSGCS